MSWELMGLRHRCQTAVNTQGHSEGKLRQECHAESKHWQTLPHVHPTQPSGVEGVLHVRPRTPLCGRACPHMCSLHVHLQEMDSLGGARDAEETGRESILLAACGAGEVLPQNPDLPADVFTACLTTPIKARSWARPADVRDSASDPLRRLATCGMFSSCGQRCLSLVLIRSAPYQYVACMQHPSVTGSCMCHPAVLCDARTASARAARAAGAAPRPRPTCARGAAQVALRWFCSRSLLRAEGLTKELIDRIPGKQTDRKTPLGELNWVFTAITDTIAWNMLPRALFQRLFRQARVPRACEPEAFTSPVRGMAAASLRGPRQALSVLCCC